MLDGVTRYPILNISKNQNGTPANDLGDIYIVTGGGDASIRMMRANGTLASKSAVSTGNVIAQLVAYPYDGVDFHASAYISFQVNGSVAANQEL